jgi:hypothetical protein
MLSFVILLRSHFVFSTNPLRNIQRKHFAIHFSVIFAKMERTSEHFSLSSEKETQGQDNKFYTVK